MRSAQKNNRSRGRGNRKSGGGGNIVNRVFDSAGPEGKVRGTPQQVIDKYLSLARDAQTSGDRVVAENFLQHAEHYQRLLIQAAAQAEQYRRDNAESGAESATDGASDSSDDSTGDAASGGNAREAGQGDGRGQSSRRRRSTSEDAGESEDGDRGQATAIDGMTMIDAPRDDEDLLVGSEDVAPARSRRNGDGRRRRQPRQSSEASAPADAEEPAQTASREG